MTRWTPLLAGATLAALCAGCAGAGAGGSAAFSPAATPGWERSLEPDAASPLAGTIVASDYNGGTVAYLAPKTGKMLYQLSGKSTKLSYPSSVAVDRHHNTYVLGHFDNAANDEVFEILVFDANAPLQKHPKPARVIVGSHTQLSFGYLAVDAVGKIYVAVQTPANAILVFDRGAIGNVAPKAVISGSLTQLSGTSGIAIARNGSIHVATVGKVLTFARSAAGNVAPIATLAAGASSTSLDGLSYDADGNLLVADYSGYVYAFADTATGNDAPLWTLGGRRTTMIHALSAVADKAGYLYVSFYPMTGAGEVGIYRPRGGNKPPIRHLVFSYPSAQIAAMP